MNVGVFGLGKLGLPLALVLAEQGNRVIAWDPDARAREAMKTKIPHIDEPLVAEMLQDHDISIASPGYIADIADIAFIIVPTPSKLDGSFDASAVFEAVKSMSAHRGAGPVIACVSTVSPGTSRQIANFADDHGLSYAYTPTMIALGSVVHDLENAEVQLIGHVGNKSITHLHAVSTVLREIAPDTPQVHMSYESAEIAKLASNVFSTLKISFANTLGQVCDTTRGASVQEVLNGLHYRSHIGDALLKPGAGFGGPCYPRDTWAWKAAGSDLGEMIHQLNANHIRYVCALAVESVCVNTGGSWATGDMRTFAVLGRNYKEGSNYRIESFGDQVHDALEHTYHLVPVDSREADVVIIAMPLRGIDLCNEIKTGAVVLDLWRTHRYLSDCAVVYHAFGVSPLEET